MFGYLKRSSVLSEPVVSVLTCLSGYSAAACGFLTAVAGTFGQWMCMLYITINAVVPNFHVACEINEDEKGWLCHSLVVLTDLA